MNELDAEQLRDMLRVLIRKLGILQKGEAVCCGVTLSQCHAITELGRVGTLSVIELAELLNLDKSTTSRNVDNLVAAGLVIREVNPEDRRYVSLKLSDEGIRLNNQINQGMDEYFNNVLSLISQSKRETVSEGLRELLKAVNQINGMCCVDKAD